MNAHCPSFMPQKSNREQQRHLSRPSGNPKQNSSYFNGRLVIGLRACARESSQGPKSKKRLFYDGNGLHHHWGGGLVLARWHQNNLLHKVQALSHLTKKVQKETGRTSRINFTAVRLHARQVHSQVSLKPQTEALLWAILDSCRM